MRILIYSMNFHPEQTGIGKYSGEMAEWLHTNGHEVKVVCSPPYYPAWKVNCEYSASLYRRKREHGIDVFRAPLWIPKNPTGLRRLVHLLSFAASSFPLMLHHVFWRPDVVFTVAPAFVCAPTGWLTARLSGAQAWLHIQDFEVDVAFRMGLLKGTLTKRVARWIESKVLRRFDTVSTISGKMVDVLKIKGVDEKKVWMLPNWVDISKISVLNEVSTYRQELGIGDTVKVVLFSGSLAGKQGLMVIPEAAKILAHRKDILFLVCGDGLMRQQIESTTRDMDNFMLLPLQPYSRLNDLLGLAHIHLLPQSPEAEDLVLPSKLSGMLASGRPIIATCRAETEIGSIVSKCGVLTPPEDAAALADAIEALISLPQEEIQRLGTNARAIAIERFSQQGILNAYVQRLHGQKHNRVTCST
ncbi:MAG: WcaI family glycosyltransferase [Aquabacterium sp.]